MKVLKFGGSSVGTPERIKNVIKIISDYKSRGEEIAVTVSAFEKITDQLIDLSRMASAADEEYRAILKNIEKRHLDAVRELVEIKEQSRVLAEVKMRLNELEEILHGIFLVKEASPKSVDFVLSFGERLSAYIISEAARAAGISAEFLDSRPLVKTDENFGSAKVDLPATYENIRKYFAGLPQNSIQIITGFIGSTPKNETTTLGRGGSDYTVALFGAALNSSAIEIWKDVSGVMTADPRKVKKALPIAAMTYEEAMELSHFGAKVIYPPTMQPAMDRGITIRIKNTFEPEFAGTEISEKKTAQNYLVKGISSIENISILRVEGSGMVGVAGIAMRLFKVLAEAGINIILITQASSEHSICIAIDSKDAAKAKKAIEEEFSLEILGRRIDEVVVQNDLSIIAIVGENMRRTPGIAGKLFQALAKNGVNVVAIAQGSSELNISAVISKSDETKALNALHDAFFLSDSKTINLFLVGCGLIGGTLIKQIGSQSKFLKDQSGLDIKIIGLSNSKKMAFREDGIDPEKWREALDAGEKNDLKTYLETIKKLNLPNSVFVDCTASDEVIGLYENILGANVSIVTPNKKANSGKFERYASLKKLASRPGAKFFYETNVGAGLPVINTLNDLIKSGDEIVKIEAILSGTLSYIFNVFMSDDGRKFSEIVAQARQKGYTEPDPRDDLSGTDVARKLLILGREIGEEFEFSDIEVENLVPEKCRDLPSIESFFEHLPEFDAIFEEKKKEALEKGEVLRYIAAIENGKAGVCLKSIPQSHPFYSLSGSDNIISFTTQRYKETPLVVKGPGAGAEVTAAGVFADILRLSHYLI